MLDIMWPIVNKNIYTHHNINRMRHMYNQIMKPQDIQSYTVISSSREPHFSITYPALRNTCRPDT